MALVFCFQLYYGNFKKIQSRQSNKQNTKLPSSHHPVPKLATFCHPLLPITCSTSHPPHIILYGSFPLKLI